MKFSQATSRIAWFVDFNWLLLHPPVDSSLMKVLQKVITWFFKIIFEKKIEKCLEWFLHAIQKVCVCACVCKH